MELLTAIGAGFALFALYAAYVIAAVFVIIVLRYIFEALMNALPQILFIAFVIGVACLIIFGILQLFQ